MKHKIEKLSDNSEPSIIADYARRTIANLKVIEKQKIQEQNRFEITQLINSLVGIVVFPKERELQCFPANKPSDAALKKDQLLKAYTNSVTGEKLSLREVVEYLRHATAHFCIKFKAEKNSITEVQLWNYPGGDPKNGKNWELVLTTFELRQLVLHIASYLEEIACNTE